VRFSRRTNENYQGGTGMTWAKQIIHWREEETVNVSVVFTWDLPLARRLCEWNTQAGFRVRAGGPAVDLMPQYLSGVAEVGGQMYPLPLIRHNGDATFTTRGCIRRCDFCAVPKIEGEFRELTDWIPAPIVCDNNFLASSQRHFDSVIDRLKPFRGVDFNQGLDARLLTDYHVERLKELRLTKIRFSWDFEGEETSVMAAVDMVVKAGFLKSKIQIYCLINHGEEQSEAHYRFNTLRDMGIGSWPMRYQPLDALKKNSYVSPKWTEDELARFTRYWSRQVWLSKIPYSEFRGRGK
jgi:hypothetical protein